MPSGRTRWIALGLLGLSAVATEARAQQDMLPSLLKLVPTQPGVDFETPTDKAALADCKVETPADAKAKGKVYIVRDGQGKVLRRFADLDAKNDPKRGVSLDQFSYYQDGFEVYRETDVDGDGRLDDIRWMNTGGTRHLALKYEGDKPSYQWKRLSAEEATKVMVVGLVKPDVALIESVMATPAELASIGLPEDLQKHVTAAAGERRAQLNALRGKLKGWDQATVWSRFDGQMPHAIPADTAGGLRDDVLLYENGVIFAGPANGQADPNKVAYLQAGEIVRVGEVWKFVAVPQVIDPMKPELAPVGEGIRTTLYRQLPSGGGPAGDRDPALAEVERKLAQYDGENLAKVDHGDPKSVRNFHYNRLNLLREVLKVATRPEDQMLYNKQVVDDLASCYQTGLFADGGTMLDDMIKKVGGPVASYAAYRKILAESAMEDAPVNPIAHQKAYLAKLEQFLKDYPKSDEAPDALLQLAMNHEFNQDDDDAKAMYTRLAREFPEGEPGKRAVGALRRLGLDGKPLALKGTGLKGEAIDVAALKGKPVAVVFWISRAESVRRELPELVKLVAKHKDKGLTLVGVNLDGGDKAAVDAFLKSNPLPGPQIVEPDGMDGRLADEFGIFTWPTIFLVDAQGKVVSRGLRTAQELDRFLDKPLAGRADEAGSRK